MADLREQLTPFADRLAVAHHAETSLATHERSGWTPWVRRSRDFLDRVECAAPS